MTKEIGILGAVATIVVFIIIGIMLVNTAEEQSDTINEQATNLTIGFGNAFIYSGVLGILLLVIVGLGWLSKYV